MEGSEQATNPWREPTPQQQSVHDANSRVDKAIGSLGSKVTELEERLSHVLRPDDPKDDDSVLAEARRDGWSPAQEFAHDAANRVEYVQARIETIISRLDI